MASEDEARHVDMAQELIFKLLGWETSSEKEAGFQTIAKILGVQIDLSDSMLGNSLCAMLNPESANWWQLSRQCLTVEHCQQLR